MPPMNGLELRLRRVALRVKTNDLADAMGVTASRISHIEGRSVVTDNAAKKYLRALETLATVPPEIDQPSVPA